MRKRIIIKVSRLFVIGCIFLSLLLAKLFLEYISLSKRSDMVFGIIIKGYEGLSIIAGISCFIFGLLLVLYASWVCKSDEERNQK